jgi:hypothetical protein
VNGIAHSVAAVSFSLAAVSAGVKEETVLELGNLQVLG